MFLLWVNWRHRDLISSFASTLRCTKHKTARYWALSTVHYKNWKRSLNMKVSDYQEYGLLTGNIGQCGQALWLQWQKKEEEGCIVGCNWLQDLWIWHMTGQLETQQANAFWGLASSSGWLSGLVDLQSSCHVPWCIVDWMVLFLFNELWCNCHFVSIILITFTVNKVTFEG